MQEENECFGSTLTQLVHKSANRASSGLICRIMPLTVSPSS